MNLYDAFSAVLRADRKGDGLGPEESERLLTALCDAVTPESITETDRNGRNVLHLLLHPGKARFERTIRSVLLNRALSAILGKAKRLGSDIAELCAKTDSDGFAPVHYAALQSKALQKMAGSMSSSQWHRLVDLQTTDCGRGKFRPLVGMTPLHIAALAENAQDLKFLLASQGNPFVMTRIGLNVFDIAASRPESLMALIGRSGLAENKALQRFHRGNKRMDWLVEAFLDIRPDGNRFVERIADGFVTNAKGQSPWAGRGGDLSIVFGSIERILARLVPDDGASVRRWHEIVDATLRGLLCNDEPDGAMAFLEAGADPNRYRNPLTGEPAWFEFMEWAERSILGRGSGPASISSYACLWTAILDFANDEVRDEMEKTAAEKAPLLAEASDAFMRERKRELDSADLGDIPL